MQKLKLMTIIGTRPEIIRLSAVIKKCDKYFDQILVHTGQNYDYTLNQIFFEDLGLRAPDFYLDAVGKDLGETIGNIIAKSYALMVEQQPDALLILATPTAVCPPSVPSGCTFPSSTWRPATAALTSACLRRPTAASSTTLPT